MYELTVRVFLKCDEIPEADWEKCSNGAFYYSLKFLKVLEEAEVEKANYHYLLLYDFDTAIGSAVLSRFHLNLDLLAGITFISRLKRHFPNLLRVPMICCGVPTSYGQHHFHVIDEKHKAEATACVHQEMLHFAAQTKTDLLLWKEFNPNQGVYTHLKKFHYISLPTLPDNIIDHNANSVAEFMNLLNSRHRRKFKAVVSFIDEASAESKATDLQLSTSAFKGDLIDEFYDGYRNLMNRTPVKLEVYKKSFFIVLSKRFGDELICLKLENKKNKQFMDSLIVLDKKDTLYFILMAKKDARYDDALYSNMIESIVLFGVSKGCKKIHLGQTSYYAKMGCGSKPHRLETFIFFKKNWKNWLFRQVGKLLFPEINLPDLHVFK